MGGFFGSPEDLSIDGYFERYLYNKDFIQAPKKDFVDTASYDGRGLRNHLRRIFPRTRLVEYFFPNTDDRGPQDFAGLVLVFEKEDGQWMLAGVVHDHWVP
ncbi:MAG: hypothetical protein FWG14_06135 [Peptococcaceae bacterium]|nr:hypothetical protein [Peptococcaceae bacterium]